MFYMKFEYFARFSIVNEPFYASVVKKKRERTILFKSGSHVLFKLTSNLEILFLETRDFQGSHFQEVY